MPTGDIDWLVWQRDWFEQGGLVWEDLILSGRMHQLASFRFVMPAPTLRFGLCFANVVISCSIMAPHAIPPRFLRQLHHSSSHNAAPPHTSPRLLAPRDGHKVATGVIIVHDSSLKIEHRPNFSANLISEVNPLAPWTDPTDHRVVNRQSKMIESSWESANRQRKRLEST